jgi:hypothetical protein
VYAFQSNEKVNHHADKVAGRKRIQIQRNWKGIGPSILTEYKSTSQQSCLVHWIRVDELAGYIMMTFDMGGLIVSKISSYGPYYKYVYSFIITV